MRTPLPQTVLDVLLDSVTSCCCLVFFFQWRDPTWLINGYCHIQSHPGCLNARPPVKEAIMDCRCTIVRATPILCNSPRHARHLAISQLKRIPSRHTTMLARLGSRPIQLP